ncbi:MAG: class I SAM-dependent methyltransferase [Actinomycetota bacterium]|nr:class I SAM-dependent methyltransferase [Actinomycetota bacterium]
MAGIPDLRPRGLGGFDVDADRRLALELEAKRRSCSFADLLRIYWRAHPGVPPKLADRFVRGDLIGADRAEEVLRSIDELAEGNIADDAVVIEVGCGTASLGSEVARRVAAVVASDVSLAWLVLARARAEAAGLDNLELVACTGDQLPFDEGVFDLAVAADVIEHVPDASALVASMHRVLRPGGVAWLSTPNRLSLTPEPHVRLFGVGLLPRRAALAYVRIRRGVDYGSIRTLTLWRLRGLLEGYGGRSTVVAPEIPAPVRRAYGGFARRLIAAYDRLRRLPITGRIVLVVAPLFHASLKREASVA